MRVTPCCLSCLSKKAWPTWSLTPTIQSAKCSQGPGWTIDGCIDFYEVAADSDIRKVLRKGVGHLSIWVGYLGRKGNGLSQRSVTAVSFPTLVHSSHPIGSIGVWLCHHGNLRLSVPPNAWRSEVLLHRFTLTTSHGQSLSQPWPSSCQFLLCLSMLTCSLLLRIRISEYISLFHPNTNYSMQP